MKKQIKMFLLVLLIIAGGFVVVKNTLDERDISGLNRDVAAMYQDRLMAANYIYRMNDLLHKKRGFYAEAVLAGKQTTETREFQEDLQEVIRLYGATRLTSEEERVFSRLKRLAGDLYLAGNTSHTGPSHLPEQIALIDTALLDLRVLSDIQVEEASVLMHRSEDVLSRALLALRLEWVVMVLMALLIIALLKERVLLPSRIPQVQRN